MIKRRRIAVLAGGWSAERAVSLKSGEAVFRALDPGKYDVAMYDPRDDLMALTKGREEIDLAIILLHGRLGEDGRIQGMLDILGIPFVGSGLLSSALTMNKKIAKDIYRGADLRVPKDVILKRGDDFFLERLIALLGLPVFIKPVSEGSSIGISIGRSIEDIPECIEKAFKWDNEIMVEEYIEGREVSCCILGNEVLEPLPVVEIIPDASYAFFDYEAKYKPGATREICPARISAALEEEVFSCAIRAHQALKCRVWSRTDMIIRDKKPYLLETNTIPGMTENSLFPLAARKAGLSLSELLDRLIALSLDLTGPVFLKSGD